MAFCNKLNKSNEVLCAISIFKMLLYYVYGVHLNNLLGYIPDFADLVMERIKLNMFIFHISKQKMYLIKFSFFSFSGIKLCI